MVDIHTGHLPDYKGDCCIFSALYDGAVNKSASTLHQLTSSLDGGDALDRNFPHALVEDGKEIMYTRCLECLLASTWIISDVFQW